MDSDPWAERAIDLVNRDINLLFATTRQPQPTDELCSIDFSDLRSSTLAFGAARVHIPESHRIGQLERPWQGINLIVLRIPGSPEDPRKHITVTACKRLTQDDFIEALAVSGADTALVFVHGFNNTFEDCILRLAQIVWDTQFEGVPVAFSWPSKGRVRSYPYDRESAEFSSTGFIKLLQILRTQSRISKIHIIAHSMGNQVILEALKLLAASGAKRQVRELILAAPDVDRAIFEELGPVMIGAASGVTLYASAADKALIASNKFAEGYRAGDVPDIGPVILDGVETIDVTALGDELFGLNHATFARQRSLLNDIKRLLQTGDRPPSSRTGEIRGMPEGVAPPRWWKFPL